MFCAKCGKELQEGTKFCPNCGSEVGVVIKPKQILKNISSEDSIKKATETIKKASIDIESNPKNILQKKYLLPTCCIILAIVLLIIFLGKDNTVGRYIKYESYDGNNSEECLSLCKDGTFYEISITGTKYIGKYKIEDNSINLYYQDNEVPMTYTLKDNSIMLGDYVLYTKGKGTDSTVLKKTNGKLSGIYSYVPMLGFDEIYLVFDGDYLTYIYKVGNSVANSFSGKYSIKNNALSCGNVEKTIEKMSNDQIVYYDNPSLGYVCNKITNIPDELKDFIDTNTKKEATTDNNKDGNHSTADNGESILKDYLEQTKERWELVGTSVDGGAVETTIDDYKYIGVQTFDGVDYYCWLSNEESLDGKVCYKINVDNGTLYFCYEQDAPHEGNDFYKDGKLSYDIGDYVIRAINDGQTALYSAPDSSDIINYIDSYDELKCYEIVKGNDCLWYRTDYGWAMETDVVLLEVY